MSDYDSLLGAFGSIPRLPNAACKGESDLFESADPYDIDDAIAICSRCPALDACKQWYGNLPARHRPTECTVAGVYRPAPRQRKRNNEDAA